MSNNEFMVAKAKIQEVFQLVVWLDAVKVPEI
jgi:hypothetical protein